MRKSFFCFFASTIVFIGIASGISAQPKPYSPPKLSNKDSWSMILMPDPQAYVKLAKNQPLLELMTAWISTNIDSLNIKLVLCTGDLVEFNEMISPRASERLNPNGTKVDQPSKSQWESVARSFARLDGRVPYITATGNHDYGYNSMENRRSNFNKYFPIDKNFLTQKIVREVALDAEGVPTLTNAAFDMTTPHGKKMLIVTTEFAPRDTILSWASQVVNQAKYKDHTAILLTHSYMNAKNERFEKENYPNKDGNYGAAIWRKVVQPSKNIQMVFAGHIAAENDPRGHVAFRTDLNAGGKKVQQMVFNAQALGGGNAGNGGDGWLRILEFLPDGKTVKVKTFSPLFAISPTTQPFAWRTESYDEFTFELD
ncbi:metallophosphoesterase [Larkinella bovis]|uniref:Metallophosphoesterase n=1 Tax=Larkinella bovis TaxID=683041 RepID=A0ABW0IGL3_9BACT